MNLNLEGKNALVFGASQGIGRAIADCLAEEASNVTVLSRSEEKLKKIVAESKVADYQVGDLGEKGAGKTIVESYLQKNQRLDCLVINTGGPKKGRFTEITSDDWRESFESVWMSTVDSIRAALPSMQKNKFGRILIITSVAAKEVMDSLTISNGYRAGISGLVSSIARDVAIDGITINSILPGFTDTERLQELNLSEETVKSLVPAGRLGRPEEIGALAAFLCSESAAYITGQNIAVDGGYLRGQ